jgi:hypothetical protein
VSAVGAFAREGGGSCPRSVKSFSTTRGANTGYQYRVSIQAYRGKCIRFRISSMQSRNRPFMRKCRPDMRGENRIYRPNMRKQIDHLCVENCSAAHRPVDRARLWPLERPVCKQFGSRAIRSSAPVPDDAGLLCSLPCHLQRNGLHPQMEPW